MKTAIKIAIDAGVTPASAGGVAQVMLGLIHALGQLDDGPEEYLLVTQWPDEVDYFKPYAGANQQFVMKPQRTLAQRATGRLTHLTARFAERRQSTSYRPAIHLSDGFYESLDCEVVHFPHQRFILCALPSIYNPHDLQHVHFPQFFTAQELAERDTLYQAGCHFAHTVAVSSQWVKDDLIRSYRLAPDKIQIIPWGPPTQNYPVPSAEQIATVQEKHKLEQPFALYPAMTWPHKNHLRLLEALARLRDERGLSLRLVCTGSRLAPFWSTIERRIGELNLWPQVQFLGFVSELELRAIYRLAQFLVMPTLFESDSSPIYEAWLEGLPVTCSNVTSLPAQVLDAARLFDPYEVGAIAEALAELATQGALRDNLQARGFRRVKDYNWERTAKAYRALYRRAARRTLSEEDRWLLSWDWMQEPERAVEAGS
ncbi:MAG: glycosyltransferase family 1 protein [Pyrinomonadaceae bacterium]